MTTTARCLPVLLVVMACRPAPIDAADVSTSEASSDSEANGESETTSFEESDTCADEDSGEEIPDLPPSIPACGLFEATHPARILAHEDDYLSPGGVVAGPDGLLAVWRRSYGAQDAQPNLIAQRLDIDGSLVGAAFALPDPYFVTDGPFIRPSRDGHALLTQCVRSGTDDRAAALLIDASGGVVQEMVILDPEHYCGPEEPRGIWTGLRHLIAGTYDVGAVRELRLAVLDEQSCERSTITLAPDSSSQAPHFAIARDGTVAMVGSLGTSGPIAIWLMTPLGELLGDATEVEFDMDLPGTMAITPIDSGGYAVWVAGHVENGLYRIEIDQDGEHVAGPEPMVGWGTWRLEDADTTAAPGGHMLAFGAVEQENYFIAWAHVDAEGVLGPARGFNDSESETYINSPRLDHLGERVFMTYRASMGEDFGDFQIRMAELGCVE